MSGSEATNTGGAGQGRRQAAQPRWTRRTLFKMGAAATAALGAAGITLPQGRGVTTVDAHNLPPGYFGSSRYSAALAADSGVKAVFQSANVEASAPAGKALNHLLLVQLKNWLNGFQFSYVVHPDDLHAVVATYASANLLTYGDAVWQKYQLGTKYNITDPTTNAPAQRNLFFPRRFGADASMDPTNPQGFFQDPGIEALQQRGVVFLT